MSKQNKKTLSKIEPSKVAASVPEAGKSPLFYAGILAAIASILYLPTLGHGFVLDDPLVTTLNAYVQKGFAGLGDVFTHSYRAGSSVSTDSEYMYRPLSVAMFAVEWAIAPKTPGIHHLINVLFYALSVGLTFLTLRKLIGAEKWLIAFGATLLFAVHPLHTEVVANIKSRDEIMSYFFSVLALYYLLDSRAQKVFGAVGAFFLAMLAKEGAVTLLVIAPFALYFFGNTGDWRKSLVLFAPFLLWFILRFAIMGKLAYTPDFNDNQLVAASLLERWATAFVVLGKYLQLLLLPVGLSWDYSFNMIPTTGWGSASVLVSFALHAGLLAFGIWGIKRRNFLSFCALAYLASMALYSNLVMLIGTMMGDRLTYQASLWFCLGLVYLWAKIIRFEGVDSLRSVMDGQNAKPLVAITGIVAVLFFGLSFQRSSAWKSNYDLVTTDAQTASGSFRALQAVGEETLLKYVDKATLPSDTARLLKQSEESFDKSYKIRPTFNNTLGLGNVAYFNKNYPGAIKWFEESYKLQAGKLSKDRLVTTWRDWGRYEGQVKGNIPVAIEYFTKSFQYDSTDTQTLIDLGTAYAMSQKPDQAVIFMEKALKGAPGDQTLRRNLALAYQQMGRNDKAAAVLGQK